MRKKMMNYRHPHKGHYDSTECDCIIARAHEIYSESLETFQRADLLIINDLSKLICESLSLVDYSTELVKEGFKLEDKALEMLASCSDYCPFDSNKPECQPLKDRAFEFYDAEGVLLKEIQEMLQIILCKIKKYGEYDELGDEYFDRYLKCIHTNDSCSCNHPHHHH